jgi:hypothetical protein
MTTTRKVLAVTALCALLGSFSACSSSDDDPGEEAAASSPAPTWSETTADCTADVKLTGAVKASWSGPAMTAAGDGREARYTSTSEDESITVDVLPQEGDVPAAPVVSADGVTYSAQTGKGTKANADGGGATVKANAVAMVNGKTKTVHVDAKFTC